jgi:predicted metal-binding protein
MVNNNEDLGKPAIEKGGKKVAFIPDPNNAKLEKLKETAQKEFDKAEANLRNLKIDTDEKVDMDKIVKTIRKHAGEYPEEEKQTEETPVIEEPELYTEEFKTLKDLKEEDYLTIEQLNERKELIKQKDQEVEDAKMQRDDVLLGEEMKKLNQMLGKEPFTSPTIAETMPTNDIIPSEKTIIGTVVLNAGTKLIKNKTCPSCNGKLVTRTKVLKAEDGIYEIQSIQCCNSLKSWKFWKKPTCDYLENIAERID